VRRVSANAQDRPEAYRRLATAVTAVEAEEGLAVLVSSGSLGEAVASALCSGMSQLALHVGLDGAPNWGQFLVGQIRVDLPTVPSKLVINEVSELLSIWDIDTVTPERAQTVYVRACASS
jgi:hypothetical protein